MIKIIMFWCVVIGLMLFTVLSYAQIIVLDPSGIVKEIIIVPPPPPVWR